MDRGDVDNKIRNQIVVDLNKKDATDTSEMVGSNSAGNKTGTAELAERTYCYLGTEYTRLHLIHMHRS